MKLSHYRKEDDNRIIYTAYFSLSNINRIKEEKVFLKTDYKIKRVILE